MARPSKLTESQWAEIEKRMLAGEKAAPLAKEFGIDRAAINRRISPAVRNMKSLANQIVSVDAALKQLPITQQVATLNLVDELKAMSSHLASAGRFGAINASKLSEMAHEQINSIDDESLANGTCLVALKTAQGLTEMANESSKIPLGLLNANKEQLQKINGVVNQNLKEMSDEDLIAIATSRSS